MDHQFMSVHPWCQTVLNVTWSVYTYTCIIVTNHIIDHALLNALQWQSTPEVILKPDQRSVIVKFECGHLPTRFVKSICFQMLLFALIVCQRSVLLVVVHGCGHFAIILQFPTHGGKGSKQRENITGQTMWPWGRLRPYEYVLWLLIIMFMCKQW